LIRNDVRLSTIFVELSGHYSGPDMLVWAAAYRTITDSYEGKPHLVLADMRGLVSVDDDARAVFTEALRYARSRGVVCCAHLADGRPTRVLAARAAYEASHELDDVTVDVESMDEAERVLAVMRARIAPPE
jgi:hypothetical protein